MSQYASIDQAVFDENGLPLYGLDAELYLKKQAKLDPQQEKVAKEWIEAATGEKFPSASFAESLKDGALLCKLMNTLNPGSIKSVNQSKMPFKQMENINSFLAAAEKYGVVKSQSFQTVDLYEQKNIPQVIQCIFYLASVAQTKGFKGPAIGVKIAAKNERQFTDEQMREAAAAVPKTSLGSHGGATQAGMRDRSHDVVKVTDAGSSSAVSRQTIGSFGGANQTGMRDHSHDVVKVSSTGNTNVPSRQTQGSYGGATQAGTRDYSREVVKPGATTVSSPGAPPPPSSGAGGGGGGSEIEQLEKLAELRDKGIITDAEFQAKKRQILGI